MLCGADVGSCFTEDTGFDLDNNTHKNKFYGIPELNSNLQQMAEDYFSWTSSPIFSSDPAQYEILRVADASLKWGGLYDVDGLWHTPLTLHRTGVAVDIFDESTLVDRIENTVTNRNNVDLPLLRRVARDNRMCIVTDERNHILHFQLVSAGTCK